MFKKGFCGILLYKLILVLTKEADLPLCPTNLLYFPQNLPMHCRMPTSADFPGLPGPGPLPTVPPFYQSPPPNKVPQPIPMPMPPGIPGPMPMPMPMPGPLPGPIPAPGSMPMPLPAGPAHKLPVIVMPFYSPDPSFKNQGRPHLPMHPYRPRKWGIRHKRRRPFIYPSDTSSSTDLDSSLDTSLSSSSEYRGWWRDRRNHRRFNGPNKMKKKKHNQRRQLLTPVLQYVTKDGYVIFEKKISKNEAKDWMNVKKDENVEVTSRIPADVEDVESNEPNVNHSREKEMVTEDNIEFITKRNLHRPHGTNSHKNKAARKKFFKQQL
ncbi:uncharacterized protein [Epargyreus clarus]|uniref:uncharacterized protein n=1 Tax=Epargyreus clarus TaxID=520877 RepID=UPI003C2CED3C